MELLIDSIIGYKDISSIGRYSGYNQIKIHPKVEEMTAFSLPKGVCCCQVMPLGLKNIGVTNDP